MVRIVRRDNELEIYSPFNPDFVSALKNAIPATMRSWNKPCWYVSSHYLEEITSLVIIHYAVMPVVHISREPKMRREITFRADYVGGCKSRSPEENMANVYINGQWTIAIRESALRSFFQSNPRNKFEPEPTWYSVLGLPTTSTTEEIKKAFRRMSRQWHPDVCKEPGATEMFIQINEANSVLSDQRKRKKYDFALSVSEPTVEIDPFHEINNRYNDMYGYRSPLRCGDITGEGTEYLGRMTIDIITDWKDIINSAGKMMVSSWQKDDTKPTVYWV